MADRKLSRRHRTLADRKLSRRHRTLADRKLSRRHRTLADRKFSRRGRTQIDDLPSFLIDDLPSFLIDDLPSFLIDDLPSCLILDILSRVPIETLVISRFVCKSWSLLFTDPLFVRLQSARSPTCLLSRISRFKRNLKRYKSFGEMVGKDFDFELNVRMTDYMFAENSCRGLLCLRKGQSIYVCNPILGEYITLPTVNSGSLDRVRYILGFSSRSNQFKVLQIHSVGRIPDDVYNAEIYTIGNGTPQWKSIGIAPPCTSLDFRDSSISSFLNGSIQWADAQSRKIVYFDFESEQFGSLPGPPPWRRDGRCSNFSKVKLGVLDGCLCIYAFGYPYAFREVQWVMKEYGVEESWIKIFSSKKNSDLDLTHLCFDGVRFPNPQERITYNPSFISLQDVAGSENFTVMSRTRTKDQDSPEVLSNHIFQLWDENAYEDAKEVLLGGNKYHLKVPVKMK